MLGFSNAVIALTATGAAAVGLVHALLSRDWDYLGVFIILTVLLLALLHRVWAHRTPVPIRRDLARWLHARAEVAGEPVEALLDRSVSAYRHGLGEQEGALRRE